ncbi:MAG TPA: C-terminal binding protein [Solirubrobacteraceae bacterium]|jgi:D-3-phosphoglycerate dehydrogenase|nr:C-terminal binding protein [Solirubrobacteraceae bacterium]
MNPLVVITDPVASDVAVETQTLAAIDADVIISPAGDEATLIEQVSEADAILVTYAPITERVIAAAPRCRIIARLGIGYDNVDIAAASQAGVVVTNVPDYCLDEVADHAMALLLASVRQVVGAVNRVRDGEWDGGRGEIHRMRGRRLALIGLGGVGRRMAIRAQAFGVSVVAYDPYVTEWDFDSVQRAETLVEAVADADYISLHSPLTEATRHVINADLISEMRRTPIIVNTSRGPLIDHHALLDGLDSGMLTGATLDVTDPEPPAVGDRLRTDPRVLVTPHMAFYSIEAGEELRRRAATEVVRVLNGEQPENAVNGPALGAAR